MPADRATEPRLTVYYDGGCPLCRREIDTYRRQRGAEACAWVDVSRSDDAALGPGLTREAALARLHVRDADGRLVSGARGFAALWQALPGTAWLGRVAAVGPMPWLLEGAYRGFLVLRRVWRRQPSAPAPWPPQVLADLRSDHAGETGAVQIYRGVLAVTRDPALRAFAQRHLATEQRHLSLVESHLPRRWHSRALPAWRVAGWLTGALPALAGPRAVYATIASVESFVNSHYLSQVQWLDRLLDAGPAQPRWRVLRDDLEGCRQDELAHRDEALAAGPGGDLAHAAARAGEPFARGGAQALPQASSTPSAASSVGNRPPVPGAWLACWTSLVGRGSAAAVWVARRV